MSSFSKTLWLLPAVVMLCASVVPANESVTVTRNLTSMPLAFTENQGQWDEQVLYRANAGGATMWFTKDGAHYQFTRRVPSSTDVAGAREARETRLDRVTLSGVEGRHHEPDSIETMMIKASFIGANPNPQMVGFDMMEYKCNYFIGNDPTQWRTDVPNYQAVVYEEVYPGIDLKYYGNGKQMEYDFIVSPGADPSQIKIQYEGAESVSINGDGELVVETEWGEVIERRPVVYQLQNGSRVSLDGRYRLLADNSFGFSVGSDYDPALPLVIDPLLSYSTYLGGGDVEYGYGIAVDVSGCAYVTGYTYSSDFPTQNAYQTDQGGNDAFVTKLNSLGNGLVYSTYLGGSDNDLTLGIAIDGSGCAYVTGWTLSSDFPTQDAYQTDQGDWDVFVTKLNSSGNDLVYSTYLGGSGPDYGYGIAVDVSGCAYVTGSTESSDFPTQNPYQTDQGDYDVFVTKMNSSGNGLAYSTYLGGGGPDYGYGITVDGSGCAYVTGKTGSFGFPTQDPYQTNQGDWDVFVTKMNSSGNGLVYSTYLGGGDWDEGWCIAIDGSGCAYVIGWTLSSDFPTQDAYQTFQGAWDVFVTKMNSSGNGLVYSTYLGGSGGDQAYGIAVDGSGCAYIIGFTLSSDFPTQNPYQTDQGDYDVFVTKMNSSGNGLAYSTYLGGGGMDFGYGIAVDGSGCAYVTAYTESYDFPTTPEAYDTSYNGGGDAFVTKFSEGCCIPPIRGNVDYDPSDVIDISDLVYMVDYMFNSGQEPPCLDEADIDGSGGESPIDISDLVYLVDYMFNGGPEPVACP